MGEALVQQFKLCYCRPRVCCLIWWRPGVFSFIWLNKALEEICGWCERSSHPLLQLGLTDTWSFPKPLRRWWLGSWFQIPRSVKVVSSPVKYFLFSSVKNPNRFPTVVRFTYIRPMNWILRGSQIISVSEIIQIIPLFGDFPGVLTHELFIWRMIILILHHSYLSSEASRKETL